MRQPKTTERGNKPAHGNPRYWQESRIDEPLLYFLAIQDLHSDEPMVRRPAITALLVLAAQAARPIRARAKNALATEFGPGVATHGLIGCAAPLSVFDACNNDDRCCHACPWQWSDAAPP